MAYVKKDDADATQDVSTDANTEQTQNPTLGVGSGSFVGGTGNSSTVSGTTPNQTQNTPQSAQGGMFSNLQSWLDNNQGGATNVGNTLSGNVQGKVDNTNTALNNATTDFNTNVQNNTNNYDSGLWNNVVNDASSYLDNNAVKTGLSGTYTGPTDITGTDLSKVAQTNYTDATGTGLAAGNVEGRTGILNDVYNNDTTAPQTSSGGLGLNQFLVQNNDAALGKVNDAATNAAGLKDIFSNALTNSQTTVKNAAQTNLDTRNAALAKLAEGTTASQQAINNALATKQAAADKAAADKNTYTQSVLDKLNSGGGITSQEAANLGLDDATAMQLASKAAENIRLGGPGAAVGNYINMATGGAFGTADAATSDQVADLLALGKLQNVDLSSFLKNGSAGNAGSVNLGGLDSDISNQLAAGQAREAARVEAARVEAERVAAAQEAERQAQAQRDAAAAAEAARVAQYSQPTGNPWADLANQAMLQGNVPSYNYYMLLAKQLNGYMNTNARIAQNQPVYENNNTQYLSATGGGGGGNSPGPGTSGGTSSVGGGVAPGIGAVGGLAASALGIAAPVSAAIGLMGTVSQNVPVTATPTPVNAQGQVQNTPPEGSTGAPGGSPGPGAAPGSPSGSGGPSGGSGPGESGNGPGAGNGPGNGVGGSAGSPPGSGNGNDAGGNGGDTGDDGDGGGGGGGGGGKIICTAMNELYGLPPVRNKIWVKYAKTHLQPEHQIGYHKVFLPLVAYGFKQGDGPTHLAVRKVLEWIAINRTEDIEQELSGQKRKLWRIIVRGAAEKALYLVGKMSNRKGTK